MKKKVEWMLVISIILLSLFGLLMIYSSSYVWSEYKYGDALKYVKNQGLFFIIGLVLMYVISKIDYYHYYNNFDYK